MQHHLPEPAISVLANDNLEVACSVVERVAMDRGKREILNLLSGAVIMRRKHREQSSSPFCDTSALPPPQYTNLLPDFLRLKPHGLEAAQQQVYGNFGKVRAVTDGPVDSRAADYDGGRISTPVDSLGGAPLYPVPTAVEKFTVKAFISFHPIAAG